MSLDLAAIAFIMGAALLGVFQGAAAQAAGLAGLAAGFLGANPAAALAAPALAAKTGFPPGPVQVVMASLAFPVLYAATSLIVGFLFGKLLEGRLSGWNNLFGFVIGGLKALACVYLALSCALFFERRLPKDLPWTKALRESEAAGAARRYNLFSAYRPSELDNLEILLAALKDPKEAKALAKDSPLGVLLTDPRLQRALGDAKLPELLRSGNFSTITDNPKLKALLDDPKVEKALKHLKDAASSKK